MGTKQLIDMPTHDHDHDHGCWQWLGRVDPKYRYGLKDTVNGRKLAHKWVYETFAGSVPDKMRLDNTCGNPSCVRPDHYRIVEKQKTQQMLNEIERQAMRDWYCFGVERVLEECPSLKSKKREQIISVASRMGLKMNPETRKEITRKAVAQSLIDRGYEQIEAGSNAELLMIKHWPIMGSGIRKLPELEGYTVDQVRRHAKSLDLKYTGKPKIEKTKRVRKIKTYAERIQSKPKIPVKNVKIPMVKEKKRGRKVMQKPLTHTAKIAGSAWGYAV